MKADVVRVLVADDHAIVREGIRRVLGADPGFDVVGEAVDGRSAVRLAAELLPDVIVLDLSMPEVSGFEAAEELRRVAPLARILVLSVHDHDEYVARSVRAGAHGYLQKDSSPAELRDAIRAVARGDCHFPRATDRPCPAGGAEVSCSDRRSRLAELTAREREVLTEIARGRSNKEISARFSISVRTVESHREALMRKLCIRGTAALTRFAIDHHLLD